MSFQYPPASISIIKGNDFYRIKAQAVDTLDSPLTALGPGDLIPIDVGFSAIAVGPESDYEKYELLYPDPTAPGGIQRLPFSKDTPFIGRISADNTSPYVDGNGEKAKAFIRVADIGTLLSTTVDGTFRIAEALADLIVYTGQPPNFIPTKRVPNRRASNVPLSTIPSKFIRTYVIPGYGRRIFTAETAAVFNDVATMTVNGIRMYNPLFSNTAPPEDKLSGRAVEQLLAYALLPATSIPNNLSSPLIFSYNADTDGKGYFDFYQVTIDSTVDALPSDGYRGTGALHLTMEVRD